MKGLNKMDYRYERNSEDINFHKQRIAFIILNGQVEFLNKGSNMSHYEYCKSKGMSKEEFNKITRGFYLNGDLVFYKDNFIYDDEVISNALKVIDLISKYINKDKFNIYFGELPNQDFKYNYYYGKYIKGSIIEFKKDNCYY